MEGSKDFPLLIRCLPLIKPLKVQLWTSILLLLPPVIQKKEGFLRIFHRRKTLLNSDLPRGRPTQVVESTAQKIRNTKLLDDLSYQPSEKLMLTAVYCFQKKTKRHFFRDGMYLMEVMSSELEMSLTDFLEIRGWRESRIDGGRTVTISYIRCKEWVDELAKKPGICNGF